jgi:hypothetical protein
MEVDHRLNGWRNHQDHFGAVRQADGEPFTVRYHLLGAMLLNEVQRQERQIQEQQDKIDAQASQIVQLQGQLAAIEALVRP